MQDIDWEQRRYEIALHVMQGIIANSHERDYRHESYGVTYKEAAWKVASYAVAYADALIQRLKQEEKINNYDITKESKQDTLDEC